MRWRGVLADEEHPAVCILLHRGHYRAADFSRVIWWEKEAAGFLRQSIATSFPVRASSCGGLVALM